MSWILNTMLVLLGGFALGAWSTWRFRFMSRLAREIEALKNAAAKPVMRDDRDAETLRFLYDKRLTLFNVRREHEWKIYFGAFAVFGAADAAVLTNPHILSTLPSAVWAVSCAFVAAMVLGYERDLQIRNGLDRDAMDELYNCLCDKLAVPPVSPIRERLPGFTRPRLGWAIQWQAGLLLFVTLASAALPFIL